ncbi:hypothetical protein SAMN05421853_12512 [Roseivivax halotolerans]|uniref:Uncharacterized protein n=1 Tax=Roseivivax halotolerans TaxID=93684 RepID=A0A1I6AM73_9RHOB|nr:hypothetical protein [Roseivivax halotolerans]SFQ69730.1 hypothetical protein SAMN05421853_12512 [Roseivivax halotolerans]
MKTIVALSIFLTFPLDVFAGETTFVVGSRPWNFSQRSRENHITMHMRGPEGMTAPQSGAAVQGGSGGPGYVSNSYAIGNWVQVDMVLGDGSEGLIMIENDQTNNGDQQSVSDILGELIETYQADDQANYSQ